MGAVKAAAGTTTVSRRREPDDGSGDGVVVGGGCSPGGGEGRGGRKRKRIGGGKGAEGGAEKKREADRRAEKRVWIDDEAGRGRLDGCGMEGGSRFLLEVGLVEFGKPLLARGKVKMRHSFRGHDNLCQGRSFAAGSGQR